MMEMRASKGDTKSGTGKKWIILLVLLLVAGFMYVSVMYKIINFGA